MIGRKKNGASNGPEQAESGGSGRLEAGELLCGPLAAQPESSHAAVRELPLDAIEDGFQPRLRPLTKRDVKDLMESIAANGQTAPIIVQPNKDAPGKYYVQAGHRRCAALRFLGRATVQAVVRHDLDERAARQLALADNLAREDLTAFEQANALRGYCHAFDMSVEAAAEELGLGRRTAFRLKAILSMPEPVQLVIRERGISARAAELLAKVAARRPKRAVRLADKLADGKLTIKALEAEAKNGRSRAAPTSAEAKDVQLMAGRDHLTLKLDLLRETRTQDQINRVVDAVAQVLAHIGVQQVQAAGAVVNDDA